MAAEATMHNSFWWDVNVGDLLFNGLTVENVTAMVVTCLVFVLLAVLLEGFKVLESKVRRDHNARTRRAMQGVCAEDRSNLLRRAAAGTSSEDQNAPPGASEVLRIKCTVVASRALLYASNTGFKYLMMLAVMLYNGYLVLAIILGITIGYYLFGHISVKYSMARAMEQAKVVTICAPECEEPEGSTPPLLQGSGASQSNLYSCVVHSQTQHLLDGNVEISRQTGEDDCCDSSKAKKTNDVSKIKSSKDAASLGAVGSERREGEAAGGSNDRESVQVVLENERIRCQDRIRNGEGAGEGVCAKAAKRKNGAEP